MKENQTNIYYITGESKQSVESAPFVEKLKKKGYEVLYMVDPIDEYAVQQLKEYDGKKLVSITKEGLNLEEDNDEKELFEKSKEDYSKLCEFMKNILGDSVSKVIISNRMVDSPCVLVTGEYGWSANMERIMKAQALRDNNMEMHMRGQKTMELNYQHPIIEVMKQKLENDENDKTLKDLIWLMYDSSLLTSGFSLQEPTVFASRIYKLIKLGLSIDEDEEEDEDLPEIEEDINLDASEDTQEENTMEEVD